MSAAAGGVTVRVPATTANLGPGFDALGAAVTLWNEFDVVPGEGGDPGHLVATSYRAACAALGLEPTPVVVTGRGDVPRTRGLGSSSTCVVAGVLAAAALHGRSLSEGEAVDLATAIEGHPDNVAPAILGGVVAAVAPAPQSPRDTGHRSPSDAEHHSPSERRESRGVAYARIPLARDLPLLALIPDHEVSTAAARAALPATVPFADAVANAGRSALLVAALATGDVDQLAVALDDRLHQPYRAPLVPGVAEILRAATAHGAWGSYVSGAGPTLMVVGPDVTNRAALEESLRAALADHPWRWDLVPLAISAEGATVRPLA